MVVYYTITFFILGTILGSFYNVVGDRLPKGESIVLPRSHCPICNHVLSPLELIPIFSYLFQKGRCKNCHKKIPLFHPIFEFASGVLFALSYLSFGLTPELIIVLTFVSMLLIIFVSDIQTMIIPDEVLLVTGILLLIEIYFISGFDAVITSIFDGIIAFLIMYTIKKMGDFLFKKESMGGGDIKLLFLFGVVLGWPLALISIFLGSCIGLPIAILTVVLKKDHEIPFGPLLALGALVLLFSKIDISFILSILS